MVKKIKCYFDKSGVQFLSLKIYKDKRGHLLKALEKESIRKKIKDIYISKSKKNVFRGLHYNNLINELRYYICIQGKFLHYFYDMRKKSKTYKKLKFFTNSKNNIIIMLTSGIAHGVLSLKDNSLLLCLNTAKFNQKKEKNIFYEKAGIKLSKKIILSRKDRDFK